MVVEQVVERFILPHLYLLPQGQLTQSLLVLAEAGQKHKTLEDQTELRLLHFLQPQGMEVVVALPVNLQRVIPTPETVAVALAL